MNRKVVFEIMLTLLLIGMLTLAFDIQPVKAESKIIYVDDDNTIGPWDGTLEHPYQNITSGLEHAVDGDTVFVYNGTYHEQVVIRKNYLRLIGENKDITIIDGGGSNTVVYIYTQWNITISGFTIMNSGWEPWDAGIWLDDTAFIMINNSIIRNNLWGISSINSFYTFIDNNIITNNSVGILIGILLVPDSWYHIISHNTITNNTYGISLGSTVRSTKIYHNNFINNTLHAKSTETNIWDDGYPSGGNYWSDYAGVDFYRGSYQNETGRDGIGDTPYFIDQNNADRYPLMKA